MRGKHYLLGAVLALAACGRDDAPPAGDAAAAAPEDKVLHVYNWSGYIGDDTLAAFEGRTGIKVIYDVYDANEVLEAKLMAGRSGYDVVFPSAYPFAERHIKANLYRALDRDKLPNFAHLDATILRSLQPIDPGNAHLVPYLWGTTGIGYNVAMLAERLGDDVPRDDWSLLFDPAVAAKLADCGIAILDDDQEAFGSALLYLGRDPNAASEADITAVADVFRAIRPHVRYFSSSQYVDDLANGEICLALGYSGDVLQARERAAEAGSGVEVAYALPRQGALRWIDTAAIPIDAPHPDNAHAFLDYLMEPSVIAAVTNEVAYANANHDATSEVDASIRENPGIYPPDDVTRTLVNSGTLPDEVQRSRVRAWTSIKTRE